MSDEIGKLTDQVYNLLVKAHMEKHLSLRAILLVVLHALATFVENWTSDETDPLNQRHFLAVWGISTSGESGGTPISLFCFQY